MKNGSIEIKILNKIMAITGDEMAMMDDETEIVGEEIKKTSFVKKFISKILIIRIFFVIFVDQKSKLLII